MLKTVTIEYDNGDIQLITGVTYIDVVRFEWWQDLQLITRRGPIIMSTTGMRSVQVRTNGGPK